MTKLTRKLFLCVHSLSFQLGIGGYQADIIQLGIDQLNDASTEEIKCFITWYAVTIIIGGTYTEIIFLCLTGQQYKSLELLFVCLNITLALILLLCFNNWLIKEPVKKNPYKLVKSSNMLLKTSVQDVGVPLLTVKMSFLLVLTLVRANMEDHSQQSRLKMLLSTYSYDPVWGSSRRQNFYGNVSSI